MKLHNTLTKQIAPFKPLKANKATMYSCGPTVYDHIHIGNLRAFIAADLLRRTLTASAYTVKHVMNFTDVDDKTIRRSAETYPDEAPEVALKKLTTTYEGIFLEDMQAIGNDTQAIQFIQATDSIQAMQDLIADLYKAKIAYIADDGVYFSIKAYQAAGKTYGQLLDIKASNTSEARIDNDEYDKDSVHDFALWKTRKSNEPAWDFELGGHNLLGRPGWHIECSAMSTTGLGQPFDIHTGGIDLIFPHHENEIAQSTGTHDNYANYFVHNEHLLVEGRKMAKSLGNFFTLRDIQEKGFAPMAFRVMALQAHYRNQLNFSWDSLQAAQNRLNAYYAMAAQRWQISKDTFVNAKLIQTTHEAMLEALQNDLDTPTALERLSQLENAVNTHGLSANVHAPFNNFIQWVDETLGLDLASQIDLDDNQKKLLHARQAAREAKDWAQADTLRDQLAVEGIVVRDSSNGQVWTRELSFK